MARRIVGTVVSDKADKTIVVASRTRKTHPIYKKTYVSTKKFMAHDEKNEAKVGDRVSIIETRPLSARKRFALRKVIEKAAITESDRVDAVAALPEEEAKS
ncbi:30S ribosomal protein S17 [Candidatus Saccharibacteria bacterium]|jgi:small subunit ribosomal protein S17|nr:MAG: 30S ribosomal protein S17 [Candidatus Saccharibacteria bacterium]